MRVVVDGTLAPKIHCSMEKAAPQRVAHVLQGTFSWWSSIARETKTVWEKSLWDRVKYRGEKREAR